MSLIIKSAVLSLSFKPLIEWEGESLCESATETIPSMLKAKDKIDEKLSDLSSVKYLIFLKEKLLRC